MKKQATLTEVENGATWEPIGAVRPDPSNHRHHPVGQIAKIAESIKRYGWGRPILARLDGVLIAGHGALLAARKLGMGHVLVRRLDLDEKRARELGLLDNRLPEFAEDDQPLIDAILASADDDFREMVRLDDEPLPEPDADDEPSQSDDSSRLDDDSYAVIITCDDERHQRMVIEEAEGRGWKCRALI